MKPFESQSTNPAPETEFVSCQSIAPLLMELFDGETDEVSAKRARAHLLACQHCAQAWLEWNQTQSILRSQPVPAPPPTLLWRIILATRFAGLKSRVPFGLGAKKQSAPKLQSLYNSFEPHEAPDALKSQIFAATTRQKGASKSAVPAFSFKKKIVWPALPMLAAPALAAFLMFASRDTLQNESLIASRTVEVEESPVAQAPIAKQPVQSKPKPQPVASKKAVVAPHVAVAPAPVEKVNSEPVKVEIEPVASRRVVREVVYAPQLQREIEYRPRVEPRVAPRVVETRERPEPPARPSVILASVENSVTPVKPRPVVLKKTVVAPVKLSVKAALSHDIEIPATQVAEFRSAKPRLARLLEAQPTPRPARVSQPMASAPKVTLIAFDDSDGEEHINELQSVVADYRATLSDDGGDDSFGSDEG